MSDIIFEQKIPASNRLVEYFLKFINSARPFALLYIFSISAIITAFPVAYFSGIMPDLGSLRIFVFIIALVFAAIAWTLIIYKFFRMALIEKPENATRELISWIREGLLGNNRPINLFHMWLTINLFMIGFASIKGAIGILHPFSWDVTFNHWDRVLHFGQLPTEWLSPLLEIEWAVFGLNFFYNLWFFVMLGSLLVSCAHASMHERHRRYLTSFMLTWIIGGLIFATTFSSAGPCFYDKAGFGSAYVPLMDRLYTINETYPVWSLNIQDHLWKSYDGRWEGTPGISAFPSIHNATAVLIALYAGSVNKTLKVLSWIFVVLIFIGSIVLGWHYAVDGYAGGLIAWACWKYTPKILALSDRYFQAKPIEAV